MLFPTPWGVPGLLCWAGVWSQGCAGLEGVGSPLPPGEGSAKDRIDPSFQHGPCQDSKIAVLQEQLHCE